MRYLALAPRLSSVLASIVSTPLAITVPVGPYGSTLTGKEVFMKISWSLAIGITGLVVLLWVGPSLGQVPGDNDRSDEVTSNTGGGTRALQNDGGTFNTGYGINALSNNRGTANSA